jgi:hypothetical protein
MAGDTVFLLKELLPMTGFCRNRTRTGRRRAACIDGRGIDYERNTQRRYDGSFVDQAIPKSMLGTFVPERSV